MISSCLHRARFASSVLLISVSVFGYGSSFLAFGDRRCYSSQLRQRRGFDTELSLTWKRCKATGPASRTGCFPKWLKHRQSLAKYGLIQTLAPLGLGLGLLLVHNMDVLLALRQPLLPDKCLLPPLTSPSIQVQEKLQLAADWLPYSKLLEACFVSWAEEGLVSLRENAGEVRGAQQRMSSVSEQAQTF